ncbi:hypothetical protein QVA66_04010 [Staphylococcus chromogenes]|nr:hypothetical protein [Staphylococcus chromogenes]
MTTNEIFLAILTTIGVPVFTWWSKRRIDQRAADEQVLTNRLKEQRADFEFLLTPMKDELKRLQTAYAETQAKVDKLEKRLDNEERDNRLLLATLFEAVEALTSAVPPIKIYLPARVQELLSAAYGANGS